LYPAAVLGVEETKIQAQQGPVVLVEVLTESLVEMDRVL
jgi:hypothetical protein